MKQENNLPPRHRWEKNITRYTASNSWIHTPGHKKHTQPHALIPALTPQVAVSKAVAEASIEQLRAALKDAREATVARATALADALGVNPPRNLLERRVPNEHRERLSARDVTAGGCTYRSSSLPTSPQPVAKRLGGGGEAVRAPPPCDRIAAVAKKKGDGHHPWPAPTESVCHDRKTPPNSPKVGPSTAFSRDTPQSFMIPDPSKQMTCQLSPRTHPLAEAGATGGRVENRQASSSSSSGGSFHLGWNRKWCRSVDAWCRNASARFRSRLAGEVVRSARRLHWLAGSGRDYGRCAHGDGGCVNNTGGSVGTCSYDAGFRGKGAAERRNTTSRFTPSETVGAEGWAALAKFGDVADLLEIVESTAELVVSIKVYSTEQRQEQKQQMVEEVVAVGEEKTAPEPNPDENGSVVATLQGKGLVPPREDDISRSQTTRNDSPVDAFSRKEEGVVIENGRHIYLSGMGRDNTTGHRDGAPLQGEGDLTPAVKSIPARFNDSVTHWESKRPPMLAGGCKTRGRVGRGGPATGRHHSAATPSTLVVVREEGDTDMESSSSNDTEEEREGEEAKVGSATCSNDSRSGAETGGGPSVEAQTGDDSRSDAKVEEAQKEKCSGSGDGSRVDGSVTPPQGSERPLATARITLGPATVESSLGVRPLSAFVLKAGRQTQHLCLEMPSPSYGVGVHETYGRSQSLGDTSCARRSAGRNAESVKNGPDENISLAGTTDNGNEKSPLAISPVTATTNQSQPPVDGVQPLSMKPPSANGISAACTISHTEKLGLACAVEVLILPFLRIVSPSKRPKNPSVSEKTPPIRLRLHTPAERGERVSEPVDIRAQTPTTAPTANISVMASSSSSPSSAAAPPLQVPSLADSSPALGGRIVCATRYVQSPIQRWVGRVDGHRCLLSSPSANNLPKPPGGGLAKVAGQQSGGREGRPLQNSSRSRACTSCVITKLLPHHATDEGKSQPSFKQHQPQRMFVVAKVPLEGSVPSLRSSSVSSNVDRKTLNAPIVRSLGRPLGRPLCRNCGRCALQRLLVNTSLLAEGSLCVPQSAPFLPQFTGSRSAIATMNRLHRLSGNTADRNFPGSERARLELSRRGGAMAGSYVARGRLADWTCSSGAVLCNACLRSLRSAEISVKRL